MSHTPANKTNKTLLGFFTKKTPSSSVTSNSDNITPTGNTLGGEASTDINNNNAVLFTKDMNNENAANGNDINNNDKNNDIKKEEEKDAVEKNMEALFDISSSEGSPKSSSSSQSLEKDTEDLEVEATKAKTEVEEKAKEGSASELFPDTSMNANNNGEINIETNTEAEVAVTEEMELEEENDEDAKIYIPPPGQTGLAHAMEDACSSPVASASQTKSNNADEAYTISGEAAGDGASDEAIHTYMTELSKLEEEEDICDKILDMKELKEKVITASLVYHDTTATDGESKNALIEALCGVVASACQGREGVDEEGSKREMETDLADMIKELDEDQKAFSFYNELGFDSFKEKIGLSCQKYTNKSSSLFRWEAYAAAAYFPSKLYSRVTKIREWRKCYGKLLDACTTTMAAREAREAAISDKEVKSKQRVYDNSVKALDVAFKALEKKKTQRNEKIEKEARETREKEARLRAKEIEKEARRKGKQKEEEAKKQKQEEDKLAKEAAKQAKDAERKAKEMEREAEKKRKEDARLADKARKDAEKQAKEAEKQAKEDEKKRIAESKEAAERARKEKNKKFFSSFLVKSPAVSRSNASSNQGNTSSSSVSSSISSTETTDKATVAVDKFEKELSSSISHSEILEQLRNRYQDKESVSCRSILPLEVTIVDSNAFNAAERDQLVTKEFDPFKRYLYFSESRRPAYYGTHSKISTNITGRNPLGKDEELDYEDDSADEWSEEGGDGDSLGDDALLSDEEGGLDYECDDFLKAEGDFGSDAGSDNEDLVAARMSSGIEPKKMVGPRFIRLISNITDAEDKEGNNSTAAVDMENQEDIHVYFSSVGEESYEADEGNGNLHYRGSSAQTEDYVSYDGDDEQCKELLKYRARIYNANHLPQLVAGVELEPSDGLDEKKVKEDPFTDSVKGVLAKHIHGKKDGIEKLVGSFLDLDDDYNNLSKLRIQREIKNMCKTGRRTKHEQGYGNPRWVVDMDLSTQQKCGITPPLGEVQFSPAKEKKSRKRKTADVNDGAPTNVDADDDVGQSAVAIPPPGSSGLSIRASADALPEAASSSSEPLNILKPRKKEKAGTPLREKEGGLSQMRASSSTPSSSASSTSSSAAANGTGAPACNVLVPRKKQKSTPEAVATTTTTTTTKSLIQMGASSTTTAATSSTEASGATTINQLIPKSKPK